MARMEFEPSARTRELVDALGAFMDERVLPAESVYEEQLRESGDPHFHPPVMEELKAEARARGLWNLFHPDPEYGLGLSNVEYAPLAEITGRSHIGPEAVNCIGARHRQHGGAHGVRHATSRRSAGCGRCSTARSARRSR